jgi:hypothetical protein
MPVLTHGDADERRFSGEGPDASLATPATFAPQHPAPGDVALRGQGAGVEAPVSALRESLAADMRGPVLFRE